MQQILFLKFLANQQSHAGVSEPLTWHMYSFFLGGGGGVWQNGAGKKTYTESR